MLSRRSTALLGVFVLFLWFGAAVGQPFAEKKNDPEKAPDKEKVKEKDKDNDKDKDKEKDKDKDKEKEKEKEPEPKETKPEPQDPARAYLDMLASEKTPTIRKRLVMAVMNLGPDGKSALPTLFILSLPTEKDLAVRKAAQAAIKQFKGVEVVDALVAALQNSETDSSEKRISCEILANIYYFRPDIDDAKKKEIYRTLEFALVDAGHEVRLAAAVALETIDRRKTPPE